MGLEYLQIPIFEDNYIYVLHSSETNFTAVVDPGLAEPVIQLLEKNNWHLNAILNTHHHWDHTDGNEQLKQKYNCTIYAHENDKQRVPHWTKTVNDGDIFQLGPSQVQVLATPGHTLGHICYYFTDEKFLFCGDTLFSMGCGRLFEGSHEQMQQSLKRIRALDDDVVFFCAHEYTLDNIRFARHLEPDNSQLADYEKEVLALRSNNQSSVPSDLKTQKQLNPFLRWDDVTLRQTLKLMSATDTDVFRYVRTNKDHF